MKHSKEYRRDGKVCSVCPEKRYVFKAYGDYYCSKHYSQLKNHGKIFERTYKDPNLIEPIALFALVTILNKKSEFVCRAIIDKDDIPTVSEHNWHICSNGYVSSSSNIKLHQLILGKKDGLIIDHINGNKLDNRRSNLRFVTHSQNGMNRLSKRGIFYRKDRKKWQVKIWVNYKQINIGSFINKVDAEKAREQAEIKYFGEFRRVE